MCCMILHMTVFDLLFIVLVLAAIGTLVAVVTAIFRGRRSRALSILRRLVLCAAVYSATVYIATAFSKQRVLRIGDPQCSDDWCLAVEGFTPSKANAATTCEVTLRIFSRARRVAQRENVAKDVYLLDANDHRYNPVLTGSEIPLNTLLQPEESVTTSRNFMLPTGDRDLRLMIDRTSILPFCVVIGECGAFHKGAVVRLD